ncbi:hypothetical protein HJ526_07910 [Donghicola sp. C2-DW-16]|uniref:Glycosyltransferase n=1 Tax=Donghicola mangrovi TaxID=2729614 RepID=A0ABX2PE97_9RHOB|nr:hypothetical protein [Donghicola mangrovi]NVO27337.1 hypothetical protein [Donghicola mangrovi]
MAQVPATPKMRRFSLLTAARLFGPELLLRNSDLQASERAALALRAAKPAKAPENPVSVFLIPLVGPHHVGDWAAVCARLNATLRSFIAQTDTNWRVLICGQASPDLPDDPRITFVPFTTPVEGNDKWLKLCQLADTIPTLGIAQGYAMSFDADDLAHPTLVQEMHDRRSAGGYLMTQGYVYDVGNNRIALAQPASPAQPLCKPFWKLCGSCAALAFDLTDQPEAEIARIAESTQHEHRMFPYLAQLAGRPLTPLSGPEALYLLNHGENFGARRGRVSFKQRFAERFQITDAATLTQIRQDFALD